MHRDHPRQHRQCCQCVHAAMQPATNSLPVRTGAPDCQYYLKTGKCNYGSRCKFNHPHRDENLVNALNRRDCFDYVQTGTCPYGRSCKYNHPPISHQCYQCPQPTCDQHLFSNRRMARNAHRRSLSEPRYSSTHLAQPSAICLMASTLASSDTLRANTRLHTPLPPAYQRTLHRPSSIHMVGEWSASTNDVLNLFHPNNLCTAPTQFLPLSTTTASRNSLYSRSVLEHASPTFANTSYHNGTHTSLVHSLRPTSPSRMTSDRNEVYVSNWSDIMRFEAHSFNDTVAAAPSSSSKYVRAGIARAGQFANKWSMEGGSGMMAHTAHSYFKHGEQKGVLQSDVERQHNLDGCRDIFACKEDDARCMDNFDPIAYKCSFFQGTNEQTSEAADANVWKPAVSDGLEWNQGRTSNGWRVAAPIEED